MAYPSSLCLQEKWVLLKYLVTCQLMLDMQTRQPGNPNMPTHLEGAGPKLLMNEEDDQLLEVEEDGAARKTVSVEGDMGPCIKLQEPGVSYPATQENARSLTLSISPPPITLEAARMQHSLAVNAGTPATPKPEDHGADLDPPPHNIPPPNKATEYTDHLPQQIQAPTEVQGPLESLRGEKPLCAIGKMSPAPTHTRG